MRNVSIALTVIAALTLGALGTAEAQNKGRRDGAHKQRSTSMQHRASPRKFQHAVGRRQARQHARIRQGWRSGRLNRKQVARLHRNQRHINKMQRRFRADSYYPRKHRYFHGDFRRPRPHHRRVYRVYPVYEQPRNHSFVLKIR